MGTFLGKMSLKDWGITMSQVEGLISFLLGGFFLLSDFIYIVENANKPWIDMRLFTLFFASPIGLMGFFLLGLGLFLLIKSAHSRNVPPPPA